MEYLSRILKRVGDTEGFKYFPGCKSVAMNHMAFADDLLLFCHGDFKSIFTMLRGFQSFSEASGLKVNPTKCSIYASLMQESELNRILLISKFQPGVLPFKFLGVPISGRKLNESDCDYLVDRMLSRIRTWSGCSLSYAGRLMLVNSVLNTLHTYWSSMFLLPQKAIHKIKSICRNFLWTGFPYYSKSPPVSWTTCCKSKRAGGLGITDTALWNMAAIGKHVWDIACKKDTLWVKWIHSRYLKQYDWWTYHPKESHSWIWKSICRVKKRLAPGFADQFWLHSTDHVYSLHSAYCWLQGNSPTVSWSRWVWNTYSQPKASFICWLMAQNRLPTRDRLARMGICSSVQCPLCETAMESSTHLFCSCTISRWILKKCSSLFGWTTSCHSPISIRKWLRKRRAWPPSVKRKHEAIINLLIYHIWHWRNIAVHDGALPHREVIWKTTMYHLKLTSMLLGLEIS